MDRFFKILLAEDSTEDAHLTQIAFQKTGLPHTLHTVVDGEACLTYLNNIDNSTTPYPDLILLDLNMPKRDGKSVLMEIKKDVILKEIPTIILSTSEAPEDIYRCYELMANCVLSKPLSFKEFCKMVAGLTTFWLGHGPSHFNTGVSK